MTKRQKMGVVFLISLCTIVVAVGVGSVFITPAQIAEILGHKLWNTGTDIPAITVGILWDMRLPRVLLAFLVGGLLSVSGVVMQSILQNSLASSYTLGVSSGAALAVAVGITLGMPNVLGVYTRPFIGLLGGILTVILVVAFSSRMDSSLGNQTIILLGMVFSMFANAMLTLVMSLSRETQQQMLHWQMGSFSLKDWSFVWLLIPVALVGVIYLTTRSRELDNLTFGEEAALAVGVDVHRMKWVLLCVSAALTGCAVALVGVIGFLDLIIPHITRRVFGSRHQVVIPLSFFLGGSFMVVCDIIARTILSPSEIPIGVVTAILGAPFFVYMYFKERVG